MPVLAAALDGSGTWTYRPGNAVPPPAWPEGANANAELHRRILARHLTEQGGEQSGDESGIAGPSRGAGTGADDVDMMID